MQRTTLRAAADAERHTAVRRRCSLIDFPGTVMRPLRYSINVTLDGCCDHRAMVADEDLHRHLAGHGPTLFAGLSKRVDLKLVSRLEFGSGAVAMRYEPRR
jgi:hypothetical protein